jgi:hypothetical protein
MTSGLPKDWPLGQQAKESTMRELEKLVEQ